MSTENRLTSGQLAALIPGDVFTIESSTELGRRRYATGTVARITERHVVVRCGAYIECYGLRDGFREGGAGRAELVTDGPLQQTGAQSRTRRIDRLQRLHEAIGEVL